MERAKLCALCVQQLTRWRTNERTIQIHTGHVRGSGRVLGSAVDSPMSDYSAVRTMKRFLFYSFLMLGEYVGLAWWVFLK